MGTKVYPHNLLTTTTHYLLETIEAKQAANDQHAILLDCIACLTFCAASTEALVNWMGSSAVSTWKPKESVPRKLKESCTN